MANLATLALVATRGEARTFSGTHYTTAAATAAANISGWTIVFTTRDLLGRVLFSAAGTVISGIGGTYSFSLTAAQTTLDPASYVCDLWRTDSGSETIMGLGTLQITGDVRV